MLHFYQYATECVGIRCNQNTADHVPPPANTPTPERARPCQTVWAGQRRLGGKKGKKSLAWAERGPITRKGAKERVVGTCFVFVDVAQNRTGSGVGARSDGVARRSVTIAWINRLLWDSFS